MSLNDQRSSTPPLPAKRELLRISAQVMRREDATNLWKPLGGTNMCSVAIKPTSTCEYIIIGEVEGKMVLRCPIRKDLQYCKPMPTFHHWCSEKQRFGLTFQSVTDAVAFDKCLSGAIDKLRDDNFPADTDDGEVFVAVELPLGPYKKESPAKSAPSRLASPLAECPISSSSSHLERIHYVRRTPPPMSSPKGTHSLAFEMTEYSYVHLAPSSCKSATIEGGIDASRGKLAIQLDGKNAVRCIYCKEYFNPNNNTPCRRYPEPKCIRQATCLCCADCLICRLKVVGWKKWCLITVLAFFLPCICCYPILSLSYRCSMCSRKMHKPSNLLSSKGEFMED